MSGRISIERGRTTGITVCRDCDRLHRQCTRERVRQHVAQTGHTASYEIMDVTVYRPVQPPPDGGDPMRIAPLETT